MRLKRWQIWVTTQWSQWNLGRLVIYALFGAWVIYGNPFGLSTAADQALSAELSRIRAYLSPVASAPITVVEIDHESIRLLHQADNGWLSVDDWPLGYDHHARILRDLSMPEGIPAPKGIFYDIFFERPHVMQGDMPYLGRTLDRLQADSNNPTVYLAGGGVSAPMDERARRALGKTALSPVFWEADEGIYPLHAKLKPSDPTQTPAPLLSAMPANALYLKLCEQAQQDCQWANKQDAPSLAVQWEVKDLPECSIANTSKGWSRTAHVIKSMLLRMVSMTDDKADYVSANCLPYHRISLAQFYQDPSQLKPPYSDEPYAVLVGVVMRSMGDYHLTPTYAQIAGVHIHAMALENLHRLGPDYIREHDVRLLSLGVWIAVLLIFWIRRQRAKGQAPRLTPGSNRPPSDQRWIRWLIPWLLKKIGWLILFSLAVLSMYYLFYETANIAPEGWLSLIALVPILREVVASTENRFDMENENDA